MLNFKKEKTEEFFDTDDRLIVWDQQNLTCEIHNVTEVRDDAVVAAGRFVAPRELCNVATSREGRIFMYQAPPAYLQHAEKLAKLEKSSVLQAITNYKPEEPENPNRDMKFFGVLVVLFVAVIMAAF